MEETNLTLKVCKAWVHNSVFFSFFFSVHKAKVDCFNTHTYNSNNNNNNNHIFTSPLWWSSSAHDDSIEIGSSRWNANARPLWTRLFREVRTFVARFIRFENVHQKLQGYATQGLCVTWLSEVFDHSSDTIISSVVNCTISDLTLAL